MTRHAQEYWLRLQAARAIEIAMEAYGMTGLTGKVIADEAMHLAKELPDLPLDDLNQRHRSAIVIAARALSKAELLHREIVGRGGQGEAKESVD